MEYKKIKFKSLGTNNEISIFHKNFDQILYECKRIVEYYHKLICRFYDDMVYMSNSSGNGGFSVELDPDIFYMVDAGIKVSAVEDSRLNILLGPVIDLWDFNSKTGEIPDKKLIADALELSHLEDVFLDKSNRRIYFSKSKMRIDLGALAKGFIADKLILFLKMKGVISALINLGGNIYCHGFNFNRPDLYWRIGIQKPFEKRNSDLLQLKLNDKSVVTSGIYERFFMANANIFHHILDPRTGYPIDTDMQSLTIISSSSFAGEIWSTALYGMDFEAIEKLANLHDFSAIAIYADNIIKYSKNLREYIRRSDS